MRARISLVLKGFLMGAADVIPGVSGGTVALVVGIYRQLVYSVGVLGPGTLLALPKGAFWSLLFKRLKAFDSFRQPEEIPAEENIERQAEAIAFLITLFFGIAVAGLTMVRILPHLLSAYPEHMSGFFFGLVLCSAALPFRMIRIPSNAHYIIAVIAAVATFMLMDLKIDDSAMGKGQITLSREDATESIKLERTHRFSTGEEHRKKRLGTYFQPTQTAEFPKGEKVLTLEIVATRSGENTNLPAGSITHSVSGLEGIKIQQESPTTGGADTGFLFVFIASAIAICAMILPGISGSFLLLMMGQYGFILHKVYRLVYERDPSALPVALAFGLGISLGIIAFSRVLTKLLDRAHDPTMAALTGLMLGSLRKIWPFQTHVAGKDVNIMPESFTTHTGITLACFVIGALIILALVTMEKRSLAQQKQEDL